MGPIEPSYVPGPDIERTDDPHRAAWFNLVRSLTPEQAATLAEGLQRRGSRAFANGRAQGFEEGVREQMERHA